MNLDYSNYKEKTLDLSNRGLTLLESIIWPPLLEWLDLEGTPINEKDTEK